MAETIAPTATHNGIIVQVIGPVVEERSGAERAFARIGASDKRMVWREVGGHILTVDHGWNEVVADVAERVVVMSLGRKVFDAPAAQAVDVPVVHYSAGQASSNGQSTELINFVTTKLDDATATERAFTAAFSDSTADSCSARSLVAGMGGRLSVESRPGHGSTFTIQLPAAEPVQAQKRKIA